MVDRRADVAASRAGLPVTAAKLRDRLRTCGGGAAGSRRMASLFGSRRAGRASAALETFRLPAADPPGPVVRGQGLLRARDSQGHPGSSAAALESESESPCGGLRQGLTGRPSAVTEVLLSRAPISRGRVVRLPRFTRGVQYTPEGRGDAAPDRTWSSSSWRLPRVVWLLSAAGPASFVYAYIPALRLFRGSRIDIEK
ncbi:hypothetical protein HPB50_018563 [Hyalomma asiaticum]|uniref:Uncharacterized protein n=1 Tax=Hyalomma asiaticum TaxID=266040 RepID=A0ACB7SX76_HYAAI|nr:hypothetical protein HPB50_018563 [Hyalomma asiaticum]